MVHAVQGLRSDRADADRDRSAINLEERCIQCRRTAYMCEREGADTVCGWLCRWCIGLMDGTYK